MFIPRLLLGASFFCFATAQAAEPLPNTKPLTENGDLAAKMVAGIHKYLDRELADAPKKRDELWKANAKEPIAAKRERLRTILGVVDERVKPNLEYVSGPGKTSLLAEIDGCKVHAVRWAVLPGVDAEGLLIEPKGKPVANVVAVPHADQMPEELAGLMKGDDFALRIARNGCRVLIPTLIDRKDDLSGSAKLKRQTNIPHREFIYRMAFEMGRTLVGYEVQKVLAAVDWFKLLDDKSKVGVIGYGDGGMIAMYGGALDERIHVCNVGGILSTKESHFNDPIDRNLWAVLKEFGDAETLLLNAKAFQHSPNLMPKWDGPRATPGRAGAAPGKIELTDGNYEYHRFERMFDPKTPVRTDFGGLQQLTPRVGSFLASLGIAKYNRESDRSEATAISDPIARQKRQFDQLVAHVQKLWRDSDAVRKDFFKKADATTPEAWEKSCDWYREHLHSEVIGKLPEPKIALNPRSRQVYDEKDFTGYEVMLDVYDDVFAQGILLMPKGLKPTERRPVVVCQHGLEGTPRHCIDPEKSPTYFEFARKLVAKGYIVYCPQNPYYGQNTFRQIQRKANPLKLSLFSFIIRQHQRTLDWLETLPNVDKSKIGFYGLSYGGKTAMRVPAIEKRYCLSICAGDFNEWIGKNVSVDLDRSYMWTGEYEMYEFNLGHTFNYAEMAYLIAPRPFMVERGHDDGVGTDEMVASEYAKVRYLYANRLKRPERTTLEFQVGGHRIFLKGTMEFLEKHLGKP